MLVVTGLFVERNTNSLWDKQVALGEIDVL